MNNLCKTLQLDGGQLKRWYCFSQPQYTVDHSHPVCLRWDTWMQNIKSWNLMIHKGFCKSNERIHYCRRLSTNLDTVTLKTVKWKSSICKNLQHEKMRKQSGRKKVFLHGNKSSAQNCLSQAQNHQTLFGDFVLFNSIENPVIVYSHCQRANVDKKKSACTCCMHSSTALLWINPHSNKTECRAALSRQKGCKGH